MSPLCCKSTAAKFYWRSALQDAAWPAYGNFRAGKLEPGETPTQALCRELAEELSVFVEPAHCRPLTFVEYPSPEFCLFMPLYHITQWQGEPRGHEGQALSWTRLHDLHSYPVPPADEALLRDLPRLLRT